MDATKRRYKADFDNTTRKPIQVQARYEVHVDRPHFKQRYRTDEAQQMEDEENRSRKLMFKPTGPFMVVVVQSHTVSIKEEAIIHMISKDRVSAKPSQHDLSSSEPLTLTDPDAPVMDSGTPESDEYAVDR